MDVNRKESGTKMNRQTRKRPREEDDVGGREAKGLLRNATKLCKRCERVDFLSYFTAFPQSQSLRLLKLFLLERTCRFCEYVRSIAMEKLGKLDLIERRRYTLRWFSEVNFEVKIGYIA